jgi:hypothetical protein
VTVTLDAADIALVRTSLDGHLRDTPPADLPAALVELGWLELHEAEPALAVAELFEAQGRLLLAATPALDLVLAAALGVGLSDGVAVAHPPVTAWQDPPGILADDATVTVDGLILAGAGRADTLLVPCRAAGGSLGGAEISIAHLELRAVGGFDESLGLVRVRGRVADGRLERVTQGWPAVAAVARRALGHELAGLAGAMLDEACRHVTDRLQFGRPVATFQAVRHKLADVHVALAAARSVLGVAAEVTDPLVADAAKALAGRAALLAAQHCLQVTGAIGFTWEHTLHRQIRRALVLDALYGSAPVLQGRIGAELLAGRVVPRLGVMGR